MVAHCIREAPLEACGVLGGSGRRADSIFPFRNSQASERLYEAEPGDVIAAVRALRERSAEFVAIYHSHPRWAAIPSKTDLATNHYGDLPRIIVSLLTEPADVRAWRLESDRYDEIPIEPAGGPVEPRPPRG